jgi:ATP-dependent RNA helicase DDX54/DBP10
MAFRIGQGVGALPGEDEETDYKNKPKTGSFSAMALEKDILIGLNRMNYKVPTPVQRKALPIALAGMDMVCMARTGSGKTCVFLLPMIQKLKAHDPMSGVRGVVLAPTRELAIQTFKFARDMAKFTDLRVVMIVGGDPIEAQFEQLATRPDIIVATPGRLMHHLREINTFKLKHVRYLVFDEADRLFEMGFAEQLNEIVRECPEERQTLLFSATMPKQLIQFSRAGLKDPQLIRLDTDTKMSDELRLGFFSVRSNEKMGALLYLCQNIIPKEQLTIIFTATRHHSELIHLLFNKLSITSTLIYGTMDQEVRSQNLNLFRRGEVSFMIVTDVAARGIDVPLLNNVINFHFPPSPKLFIHRCGRAARQGRIGYALSLVEPEEMAFMCDVHSFIGKEVKCEYDPEAEGWADSNTGQITNHVDCPPSYTLETMTPQYIHIGLFPQDVIDEENDYLKRAFAEDDELKTHLRISENGMKQYRRTRTEATKQGVKQCKVIMKNQLIKSIHPLIVGEDPSRCTKLVADKAIFVRMLQTFRPSQTVFETGIGTGTSSKTVKQLNKKGSTESYGVTMMKAFRKVTAPVLERNKKKSHLSGMVDKDDDEVVVNSFDSLGILDNGNNDEFGDDGFGIANDDEYNDDDDNNNNDYYEMDNNENDSLPNKARMSKNEKKKMKKLGLSGIEIKDLNKRKAATEEAIVSNIVPNKNGIHSNGYSNNSNASFKDKKYYMVYGNEDEQANFEEESMQPRSGLRSAEVANATMLESAFLDVQPDNALDLNRKQRVTRWDEKKRKFVKQSLEEMAGKKGAKRLRTESGVLIKGSSLPQGEMYEKWKKKSRSEISLPGTGEIDDRPRPKFRHNAKVKDELKTAEDIRKSTKQKDNNKSKNMEKGARRQMEGKQRKKKALEKKESMNGTKAGSRRCKAIIRY